MTEILGDPPAAPTLSIHPMALCHKTTS